MLFHYRLVAGDEFMTGEFHHNVVFLLLLNWKVWEQIGFLRVKALMFSKLRGNLKILYSSLLCVCVCFLIFLKKESITGKNWFSLTDHCWWLREEGRHYVWNGHSISWGNNCYWNILLRWTLWSYFCSLVGPWILSILSLKDIKLFFPDFLNLNKVVSFFPPKAYFQGLYDLSVFDC